MAHGLNSVLKRAPGALGCKNEGKTGIGSRRIFPPHFKLQVLDSYRNDSDCKGNQRATARKYGIHRRQIQKWLQAENNLRNSVGKGKTGECVANPEARKCGIEAALKAVGHRQRDDLCADACSQNAVNTDARVPAISPVAYSETAWPESKSPLPPAPGSVPLDFTTHSRSHASPIAASPAPAPFDPAAPIDLSLKRLISVPAGEHRAPVYRSPSPHRQLLIHSVSPRLASPSDLLVAQPHHDAWDLSTKSLKRKHEELNESLHSPGSVSTVSSSTQSSKPVKLFKPYLDDLHDNSSSSEDCHLKNSEISTPCCNSYMFNGSMDQSYYNNNNNNICDVKAEYTYTLHELQPQGSVSYYYPVTSPGYIYPGYECENSIYCAYEEPALLHPTPLKQRQSYSLDFKLSAIECYYQDEYCRGNQRAVASKYNIHRRQVQKWLKQEDELRQRNETIKQIHAVS